MSTTAAPSERLALLHRWMLRQRHLGDDRGWVTRRAIRDFYAEQGWTEADSDLEKVLPLDLRFESCKQRWRACDRGGR